MDKKILIIGCTGMLGFNLFKIFSYNYKFVYGTCRNKYNLIDENIYVLEHTKENLYNIIKKINPDIILNCIGILKENNYQEQINMIYANSILPIELNNICKENNIYFIHFSTDSIFKSSSEYQNINNIYSPESFYSSTKILSEVIEKDALVLRICPIGYDHFKNLSLFNFIYNNKEINIKGYRNCYFNGLTTIEIGKELIRIINDNYQLKGIHHITGPKISKYELLKIINIEFNLNKNIIPLEEPIISRLLKDDLTISNNLDWIKMMNELKIFIDSI